MKQLKRRVDNLGPKRKSIEILEKEFKQYFADILAGKPHEVNDELAKYLETRHNSKHLEELLNEAT